jgi:hypothetical protein
MPPSLEVMMNHHHHHEERHRHTGHDMLGSILTEEFDSSLPKVVVSSSTDDDNDETENSEGDENNNSADEAPTAVRMVNGEDWNHIVKPGPHDVLLGRGGGTNNHSGNIKFRKLVNEHKMRYLACSKVEKPKVARQVVLLWRKLDPPGRFLARRDETKRGAGSVKAFDNVWFEVGDKKAREKASQCLRERTPDVIPYIKQLREQQNAITEQGVSMVQMQMQQREQQQHVHLSPQRSNNNAHMNMMHMASASGGMHAHQASTYNYQSFDGPMTSPPVRRSSVSMVPPNSAPSNSHYSPPQQHTSNHHHDGYQNHRRASLPLMTAAPVVDVGYDQVHDDYHLINGDFADMSDMEYQQQMMMMQQQMMQQQLQMQRLQQTRAMRAAANGQQQHPHAAHYHSPTRNLQGMGVSMAGGNQIHGMPQQAEYNDTLHPQMSAANDYREQIVTKSKRGRDEGKTAPDRTTSLMSLTPACPDDHELSLEDYRQQLEEYIANSNKEEIDQNGNYNHGDGGNESDLEDDWEKERERAVRQGQALKKEIHSRGVNRNASGMSAMSGLLSTKSSGMSLVSGFSGFSDMSKDKINTQGKSEREQKMNMTRSVGSNLSLMSELTDLSQNIDNLSIYDD